MALAKLQRWLGHSSFASRVLVLANANLVAQALNVVFVPVLSRLYEPAEFGVLTVYTSVLAIFAVGVAARYDLAIPLSVNEKEAVNLAALSMAVATAVSLLAALVLLHWGDVATFWLNAPSLGPYLWMLPVGLWLSGAQQVFTAWASYSQRFDSLARVRMVQSLVQGIVQVGLSFVGTVGLLMGFLAGRFAGIPILLRDIAHRRSWIQPSSWRALAYQHIKFPAFNLWGALLDTVGLQMVPLLFAKFFPGDPVGFYGLSMRVVALPGVLVGQAVAQVFYPEASRLRGHAEAHGKLVASSATVLFKLGAPVFGLLFLCGPTLFSFVFGEEWREAGEYTRYLCLWLLPNFISSPLSTYVLIRGEQRAALLVTICEIVLRLLAVWGGAVLGSARLSVILYSVSGTAISLIYIAWVFRLARVNAVEWLRTNGPSLTLFLLLMTVGMLLRPVLNDGLMTVVGSLSMAMLAAVVWPSLRRDLVG